MNVNPDYMRRALELARRGELGAHPNPMVGAVIVAPDGRIVGEGYHRVCGQAHAEVNAVNSAAGADLTQTTLYVTLEPCAHYGKTPPCARLIIDRGIPRVVVATVDPFAKVSGRGIAMLREAGVEVEILPPSPLVDECRFLNRRFFTAHTLRRPYVALKWARTADGFVDRLRADSSTPPLRISSPASQIAAHRYRAAFDAIAVGSATLRLDRPRLDCRLWPGARNPERVEFARGDLAAQLSALYSRGLCSLLVEGGPTLQRSFLDAGLWDELRVETNPALTVGAGVQAPAVPSAAVAVATPAQNIEIFCNRELFSRLGRL